LVRVIRLENATKTYDGPDGPVTALAATNLTVNTGEFVSVTGPSGCGKTTLLMVVGGMLRPNSGLVDVAGEEPYRLAASQRAGWRARTVGFIFQMFHLVPYLSVLDNVLLGPRLANDERARAGELLARLGLAERQAHKPAELSAGEKQRTAIARALLRRPRLLLADEPTGNLDPENADEVFRSLQEFHHGGGTVVVVTHGDVATAYADRQIEIDAGVVVGDTRAAARPPEA
jgi:ABC-type lipoprotein export system ATPase subunit